ncbi:hypothetical protein AKK42_10340 [Klebsiella quasipneumoniae]|nr:hypothetical protein AKK42_10340 [Klebsiella quasipneumoniae]ASR21113.1 hypothetical protein AWV58_09880 [Klebsiella quasipneumoniae]ASR26562.1 hypothetical protein AWV59_13520 [Klebsiella quasipneumoniae]ASR29508.1 hypothetical protein AWV60_03490 [Klebsiella quasipneumoniae]
MRFPFYAFILHKNTHTDFYMQPETFLLVNYLINCRVYRRIYQWSGAGR